MLTRSYQQGSETSQKQNYKYIYVEHYHFQTALREKKSVYVQVYVNMNDIFLYKHQDSNEFSFISKREK